MAGLLPLLVAALALLLGGCAGQVVGAARDAQQTALDAAEFAMCQALSVAEWRRRYGYSAEVAEAWRTMCDRAAPHIPGPLPEPLAPANRQPALGPREGS